MTKIYLDNNVYQFLKQPENSELLEKVKVSKEYVIFCFSEAHLHDLNRDPGDEKYNDMKFMEKICDSNCYCFTDRTIFKYRSPTEFYNDFDWNDKFSLESGDDDFLKPFMNLMKAIPLDFSTLLKKEELPLNMPASMQKLLTEPMTMYDFFESMLSFTEVLSTDKVEYKEHLKYLRENGVIAGIYESLGIKGYDGLSITDKAAFYDSFARKFIHEGQEKTRYSLFIDMYYGLEIFGIVKGKLSKQRMIPLLDDARHAFFGTSCDIIVSNDADFLAKTKFMYELENNGTRIVPLQDLEKVLNELELASTNTLTQLCRELSKPVTEDQIVHVIEEEGMKEVFFKLNNSYFGYFNIMSHVSTPQGAYMSVRKLHVNSSRGTLVKQIQYIISRLLKELGADVNQKGELTDAKTIENKTELRTWVLGDMVVSLILDDKLFLNFYPLNTLKTLWESKKDTSNELDHVGGNVPSDETSI